jgi:(p)ppGpp synthase/HD superfamily hydrolase
MIYANRIQKAIKFAAKTHNEYQQQTRKGKVIPYITHPLTVGLILAKAGAGDEVIAAGILHDTIEDSIPEKKVTFEMLEERFGTAVAQMVLDVTETDKTLSWEERKKQSREHIKTFSYDSLLLKSADIISNQTEIIDDYERYGEQVFLRFNAPKNVKIKNNLETIETILEKWPENPLGEDLRHLAEKLKAIESGNFGGENIVTLT